MTTQELPEWARILLDACEKSDDARYGTLSIDFVRKVVENALPSEGNRERSDRTAEGIEPNDWRASGVMDLSEPPDAPKLTEDAQIGNTLFRKGVAWSTVIGRAIREREYRLKYPQMFASPPASASMSAGVTDVEVDAALLAIFPGKHDEYLRVNWRPTVRVMLEQYERARANTRAGVCHHDGWPDAENCPLGCTAGDAKGAGNG